MARPSHTILSTIRLSSGYSMPLLGLGTWQTTGDSTVKSCLAALETGYRHIDSAVVYRNEKEVGEAVRLNPFGVKREDVFVTSKLNTKLHGYDSTLKTVDESLARFGFDYIDLYLIHDPFSGKERRLATYRALLDSQKAGKIRSIGVSNYGIHHLQEIEEAGLPRPSVNQIELHPFCQQKPIVEYCRSKSIVVQAYTPLVRGSDEHGAIRRVAQEVAKDPFQVYIRWSLQSGFVPLPKSATPARIVSNANVFDFELSAEDMDTLNKLDLGKLGAVTWNPVDAP